MGKILDIRSKETPSEHYDKNAALSSYGTNHILEYAKGNTTHGHEDLVKEISIIYLVMEVLGTVGAMLILFTMIRSSTFIITYRTYLSLACLMDILLMYVHGGNMAIHTFTDYNTIYDLILQSDISCRVYHVCIGFVSQFNIWIHVALMIELFVISVFPKKLNSVSSTERAHFLTLLLATLLLIINMNYFWTIKRQKEPLGLERNELCYYDARFEMFETKVYPVIESAVLGVIPIAIWICLTAFTARRFCVQGETRPGGLLISTREYWKISYSMSSLYIVGHLPRFIWLLQRFVKYTNEAEKNPGISTLQNFHTELIDGDPWYNLPLVMAIASRLLVLVLFSGAFRTELRKSIFRACCCRRTKYTLVRGLAPSYNLSRIPLMSHSKSETLTLAGEENSNGTCNPQEPDILYVR